LYSALWLPTADRCSADAVRGALSISEYRKHKEALMAALRSERAHARARNLLATVYPIPHDADFRGLRELAIDYMREADRLEAESKGRSPESEELISAALDAVARNYFKRALLRSVSRRVR
jgi:hypothetical protein